jgi:DNA-binding transcriptional regulator YdaS (Cro superfamily)
VATFQELMNAAELADSEGDEAAAVELAQLAQQAQASEGLDETPTVTESTFTDVGRGIISAPISVAQGILELGTAGIDASFDTDYSRQVGDAFNQFKADYDLAPQSSAGKITEDVISLGLGFIPIAGWLGRASSVAKLGKAARVPKSGFMRSADTFGASNIGKTLLDSRAKLYGATALGTLGYETIVSRDGQATLSDSFDVMPDMFKTQADTGQTGSAEGVRRLSNKATRGLESAFGSLAFDIGLPAVGMAVKSIGSLPGVGDVASGIAKTGIKTFEFLNKNLDKVPGVVKAKDGWNKYFTYAGGANELLGEEIADTMAVTGTAKTKVLNYIKAWDSELNKVMKFQKLIGKGPKLVAKANEDLNKFFDGLDTALDSYSNPKTGINPVKTAAERMKTLSFEYQDDMLKELEDQALGAIGPRKQKLADNITLLKQHQDEQRMYLRRRFERYENPETWLKQFTPESKDSSAAIEEIKNNLRSMGVPTPVLKAGRSEEWLDKEANKQFYSILGLSVSENVPPKLAAENALKDLQLTRKAMSMPGPKLDMATDMFIKREDMISQSPNLRKLMGEVTDPKARFAQTIGDQASTIASLKFYSNVANNDALTMSFDDGLKALDNGGRPSFIRLPQGDELFKQGAELGEIPISGGTYGIGGADVMMRDTTEEVKRLISAGYRPLGELDKSSMFKGSYGDLSGMYVSPEAKEAVSTAGRLAQNPFTEAAALAVQAKGLAQRMTIIPNPLSQIRNIYGNTLMLASNGLLGRDANFFDSFRMFASNVSNLDDAGTQRLTKMMGELGVVETSLMVKAIKDFQEIGKDLTVAGKVSKATEKVVDAIPLMKTFERMYSDSDSFFKVMSVLGERSRLANALGKAGFEVTDRGLKSTRGALPVGATLADLFMDQGLATRAGSRASEDLTFLDVMAGDVTKATMPIYQRVGKAIKAIDRIPVLGSFTSFASENIRNSANILSRGMKEMAFTVPQKFRVQLGEDAARALEREIRGIGAQRLMSYTAVAYVMPGAVTKASMMATQTTPEELEAAKRLTAPYLNGHELSVISNDKRGNLELVDQSYVNPYAFVRDPAMAALQMYNQKGKLDASEVSKLSSAAWSGLKAVLEPFAAESLVFERARDVLPDSWFGRGGLTSTGSRIYGDSEDLGDRIAKGFTHMMGGFIPAYARLGVEERGGKLVPGRLTRGVLGIPGGIGQEYTTEEEVARVVSGFTPITINLRKDFNFRAKAYTPLRSEAKGLAQRVIKANDSTPEQMFEAWDGYLDSLYRLQSELYADVQAARTLGLSDAEIRQEVIQKGKVGTTEANMIMRGEFSPGMTTSELRKEINREILIEKQPRLTTDIPWEFLNQMSISRRAMKLAPAAVEQRDFEQGLSGIEPGPNFQSPQVAPQPQVQAAPQSVPQAAPEQSSPQAAPQPAIPTTRPANAPVPSALMGGNPFDQLRNMEIFQRLQGQ